MNGQLLLTWLVRYGHVATGAMWVGGYLILAFVMIPALTKSRNETLEQLAHLAVRILTYTGTATIFFGILLIPRTRGYARLTEGGEWGIIIITCIVIAITLLGIGDGALRPALRRIAETGDAGPARRIALLGFILTILAVGLMTRALYASS